MSQTAVFPPEPSKENSDQKEEYDEDSSEDDDESFKDSSDESEEDSSMERLGIVIHTCKYNF